MDRFNPGGVDPAAMLRDIESLVSIESPTADRDAVRRCADRVAEIGQRLLGVAPRTVDVEGVRHVLWVFGESSPDILLLGHHDTVWPLGSIDRRPFQVTGDVMTGAGCFDMKAGIVMALHAVAMIENRAGLAILMTGDEETGSQTSRGLIRDLASTCRAALVLEGAGTAGAIKTGRKGASRYVIGIEGRSAHAGLEPERGVNALVEMARVVDSLGQLSDVAAGTTVTPTRATSGTAANTVPDLAKLHVDVRAWSLDEQHRVDASIRSLTPSVPGAVINVEGGLSRPAMTRDAAASLIARAQELHAELGLGALSQEAVGGASDGNLTSGWGVPTLDGLGATGGGAHADDEHVLVGDIAPRTRFLAALTEAILRPGPQS